MQLADVSRYKNEIYGICILWIMIFHGMKMLKYDFSFGTTVLKPLNQIISFGNMGVEVFLFCSGIFLYFSFFNNPNILLFLKKRLLRIFLPVIIISGIYWIVRYIVVEHDFFLFASKLTLMDFWLSGDQQIWFVSCILVCYLIYPYIHSYLFESKFLNAYLRLLILLTITVLITLSLSSIYPEVFDRIEIALTRLPVFFIGCFFGKLVYEKKILPWYSNLICVALVLITFFILHFGVLSGAWRRWANLVVGIPLTYLFVWMFNILKFKKLNRFFAFFGTISLNLYISHIIIFIILRVNVPTEDRTILQFVIVVLASIAVAYLAELLIKLITKKRVKG